MDKEPSSLEELINKALVSQNFSCLEQLQDITFWQQLSASDRHSLALAFVAQGETLLKLGDGKALDIFELALKIAPNEPGIIYKQALAYSTQIQNMRCLAAAGKALQQVVSLSPTFFDAWLTWAYVLVRQGIFHGESHFFKEAHEKFVQAISLLRIDSNGVSVKQEELYWQWGLCWFFLGRLDGEACDFYVALEKYREAAKLGLDNALFWNNYGDSLAELSILLNRKDLLLEAAEIYRKATKLAPHEFQGWLNLACSLERLFEHYLEVSYFEEANNTFMHAAELNSENVELWLNWALLFVESAKQSGEVEHLNISFEKFERANDCEPNNSTVLYRWGEAQTLYGAYNERLDLLKSAEKNIVRSLEIQSDNADGWYIYGNCLNELGRYFSDAKFYQQAIEKFLYGLSLNERHHLLWHGLALAHFALGEFNNDLQMLEKATRYCAKVMETGGKVFPQFWNDWGIALMKLTELTREQSYIEAAITKFERAINANDYENEKVGTDLEWLYNYGCAHAFLGEFSQETTHYERAIQVLSDVLQLDSNYTEARYNLALSLAHLGVLTDDIDHFHQSLEHFNILLTNDNEDEAMWNDWGLTLLNLADLIQDEMNPELSQNLFLQAEDKFKHAIALGGIEAFYNFSCLYSLQGNYSAAMHYFARAEQAEALPHIDDVMHDEWLEGLRQTTDFRNFISLRMTKHEKENP